MIHLEYPLASMSFFLALSFAFIACSLAILSASGSYDFAGAAALRMASLCNLLLIAAGFAIFCSCVVGFEFDPRRYSKPSANLPLVRSTTIG